MRDNYARDRRPLAAHRHHAGAGRGAARAARRRTSRSPSACATGSRSSRTRSPSSRAAGVTRVDRHPDGAAVLDAQRAEVHRRGDARRCPPASQFEAVESFHAHPLLIDAFAERVRAAQPKPDELVIFTAHACRCASIEAGDRYADEVAATARARRRARRHRAATTQRLPERRPHAGAVDRPGARRS